MTPADLAQIAASAAAVAALIGLCWAIGFRGRARVDDEDEVRALAAAEAPGAGVVGVAIDAGGTAALAGLADGRLLVVRAVGDRRATRLLAPDGATVAARGPGRVRVDPRDIGFPPLTVRVPGGVLPDWLAQRTSRAR